MEPGRLRGEWLSLGEASGMLGVHPATLRVWADRGRIKVFRTPGGHRRFLRCDLEAFSQPVADPGSALDFPASRLYATTIQHVQRDLSDAQVARDRWAAAFPEHERQTWRESGRRMLGLAIQYVARGEGRAKIEQEARGIGGLHGQRCAQEGIPLTVTVRAYMFFREAALKTTRPGLLRDGRYDMDEARIHREMRQFLDIALYAMLDAYDQFRRLFVTAG